MKIRIERRLRGQKYPFPFVADLTLLNESEDGGEIQVITENFLMGTSEELEDAIEATVAEWGKLSPFYGRNE